MKLLAHLGVDPGNTAQAALGKIVLHRMPDVTFVLHMSCVEYGGRKHTGLLMTAVAGKHRVETYIRRSKPVDNCATALALMLQQASPAFVDKLLMPVVKRVCTALKRDVPVVAASQPHLLTDLDTGGLPLARKDT